MNPINPTNGGVYTPTEFDIPFQTAQGNGFRGPAQGLTITESVPSVGTEGLGAIPEGDPVRDDDLGKAMRLAFNLPPPEMPKFV